jgi:scyllo-inositol 2-dehydrogenase (NADP+)
VTPARTGDAAPAPLRVALVGFGLGGAAFHAPLVAAVPGLSLDAIVTGDAARQAQARGAYPGVRVLPSPDALWTDARAFDLVVISTPNRTHVPLARRALDAGLHVVVDKPVAPTAREACELIDHARRVGRAVVPYHNRRWDGDFQTLRRLVHEDRLGRVHRVESRLERWRPTLRGTWRESAAPEDAGGILYDLGPHLVDQALVLAGPAVSVYAELDARRAGASVDDDAFVAIVHASGVTSHLHMSALAAQAGPRFRVFGDRAAYVKWGPDPQEAALRAGHGPAGDARWGQEAPERWGLLGGDDDAQRIETMPGRYDAFYVALARHLEGRGPVPVEPADAVAGLRIIEAARTSAAERRVVDIE